MSRTRKALIVALFNYAQFGLAIVSGLVVVRLILDRVDVRTYGLWLASGETLAYVAAVDLGVFGVLPWMIAASDGRRDREGLRGLVSNGLAVGTCAAVAYVAVGAVLWWSVPGLVGLPQTERDAIAGPLVLVAAVAVLTLPLRIFAAVLAGLQDVVFNGALSVLQLCLGVAITVSLLVSGWQLYALAWGLAAPLALGTIVRYVRVRAIAGDLFIDRPRPTFRGVATLLGQGAGVWLGSLGWQMIAASNAIVITYLGHPEWVPIYVCTAKLSQVMLQMAWVLPDSGFVGLAQLHAEGRSERTREVIAAMLRLHLLLAGGVALMIVTLNQVFVDRWVGEAFFAGAGITLVLSLGVVVMSLVHGLVGAGAVLGKRGAVGIATVVNGVVYVALALGLGTGMGLMGVAVAATVSSAVTTLPVGLWLLRSVAGLDARWVAKSLVGPWLLRLSPAAAVAIVLSPTGTGGLGGLSLLTAIGCGLLYLWCMRPLYAQIPLEPRLQRWLARLGIMPAQSEVPAPNAVERRLM